MSALAISIRQPYTELVLLGVKTAEYRNRPTTYRGRVMLYAPLRGVEHEEPWETLDDFGGDVDYAHFGVIVGSVEIVDCVWHAEYECWAYILDNPQRISRPYKPKGRPQPCFFRP